MEDLRSEILDLQLCLATQDNIAKQNACGEMLRLIHKMEKTENYDKRAINELRGMVLPHLIDYNNMKDAQKQIDAMMESEDYRIKLAALYSKSMMCQRLNDLDGRMEAINKGIMMAEENNDAEALAEGHLFRGKLQMEKEQWMGALEDLNKSITFAKEAKNAQLIAVLMYYIGLSLFKMGHAELGMEKLREASDIAHEQRCSNIIMHTEVVRALHLLNNGKVDVAKEILSDWYKEFKMML